MSAGTSINSFGCVSSTVSSRSSARCSGMAGCIFLAAPEDVQRREMPAVAAAAFPPPRPLRSRKTLSSGAQRVATTRYAERTHGCSEDDADKDEASLDSASVPLAHLCCELSSPSSSVVSSSRSICALPPLPSAVISLPFATPPPRDAAKGETAMNCFAVDAPASWCIRFVPVAACFSSMPSCSAAANITSPTTCLSALSAVFWTLSLHLLPVSSFVLTCIKMNTFSSVSGLSEDCSIVSSSCRDLSCTFSLFESAQCCKHCSTVGIESRDTAPCATSFCRKPMPTATTRAPR